uniref:Uncharacterized protein n=1 Tax=viral metagenome TaxID=1070528 RepID=A0A6C0CAX5_9ZZZZ
MEEVCDVAEIVIYDIKANKEICLLLRKYFKEFYNNIYVPIDFFKMNNWNVTEVLTDNIDVLYYNDKYFRKNDKIFSVVFAKYVDLVKKNFSSNSNLKMLLSEFPIDTHFKEIISCRKYKFISPAYIADLYISCRDDSEQLKMMIKILDILFDEIKIKMSSFVDEFAKCFDDYVRLAPLNIGIGVNNTKIMQNYNQSYINDLSMIILNFAQELINMNVYAIHSLVNRVISIDFPYDIINQYDPEENNDRELIVI